MSAAHYPTYLKFVLQLQVMKDVLPSSVHPFLLLQQFGEGASLPAAEGQPSASHTCCFSSRCLAHPAVNQSGSAEEE